MPSDTSPEISSHTVERLLRQQAALANFGSFAFSESNLDKVLAEAARVCAYSLDVPFSKICRHRALQGDLQVVAGYGWQVGVVGQVTSQADESSIQGYAYVTGEPVILRNINKSHSFNIPESYAQHGIVSTIDVLIKSESGSWGVLEAACSIQHNFDIHDIDFLTGFANVVAQAIGTAERTAVLQATLAKMEVLAAEREALLEEKSTLAAELQHRVRNNLQLVHGMLLRQIDLADDSGKEGIRAIARRVVSLALIYDHLLGHGLASTIDFAAYLQSLCTNLENFQEKGEYPVTLTCTVAPIALELDLVTALGIVVTEVTSNAYLHAFKDKPGIINVSLVQQDGMNVLTIADDGIGFEPKVGSKRHGIGLIKRLMEQAKGTAELNAENGTTWRLIFPITELAAAKAA